MSVGYFGWVGYYFGSVGVGRKYLGWLAVGTLFDNVRSENSIFILIHFRITYF